MDSQSLKELLEKVAQGRIDPGEAAEKLTRLPYQDLGFARLDHHRQLRQGFPEVVFGQGKTPEQIVGLARALHDHGSHALVTRVDPDKAGEVKKLLPEMDYQVPARALVWPAGPIEDRGRGVVALVSAGTSDIPVAEEARITAELMGSRVKTLYDAGVAGLHRILSAGEDFDQAKVFVVVAGMEGALPSVVAGLWGRPTIAVPTSIGYGASFGGLAALLGMLTSCAAGVSVVNIDNGFGAGFLAGLINRR
jgi:NCAIR mutase (PurE)-related protein